MTKYDLTHVRHDPAHCLAPGLFRSLKRGERKKRKLDVTYTFGEGESLRFIGFEPLGADDMRFLQVLVAFAGPERLLITPDSKTDIGKELWQRLDPWFKERESNGLVVRLSMSKLLREAGLAHSGRNIELLKASLLRMSNVTIVAKRFDEMQSSYHLMSHGLDQSNDILCVALNPRIAGAILGRKNCNFACMEMEEVRNLQSDPARLIHQRLCGWIDPGDFGRVSLDILCSYVWPNESNDNTMRRRRMKVRKALFELIGLEWIVREYANAKFEIIRPNVKCFLDGEQKTSLCGAKSKEKRV